MKRRTLLLLRHAKSSWDDAGLPDAQRALAARGRRAAPKMGRRLARHGLHPDVIITSPARRAVQTVRLLAKPLAYRRARIRVDRRLYEAGPAQLARVVRALAARHEQVLLCGHNPGLLQFARRFAPQLQRLPTCAVVELRFQARDWRSITRERMTRVICRCPRR